VDQLLPLFPLGTVALPGMTVPLHVFEERYRALVGDLLARPDPGDRRFGIVAIREGYEVGAHEARSMYRTGCLMQLSASECHPDGRYDIAAFGRARFRVVATDASKPYLRATVEMLTERPGGSPRELDRAAAAAAAAYETYRSGVSGLAGNELGRPASSEDPTALSYSLGAVTLLPLSERQQLLEATTTLERLQLVQRQLAGELRAMRAVPSLPATEIARSGWSPN
jgi:uncharacterized protein